jgi:hypothetical protein
MSNQKEKIFADGFRFERRENAPDFVVGRLSLKVDEAITFIKSYEKGGWVNLNILVGRSGNPYVELDTYEPTKKNEPTQQPPVNKPTAAPSPAPQEEDDDIPF